MAASREPADHATRMDGIYRHQRHIYDATRKFYLLGRDRLIRDLAAPDFGTVLELGCGTGRNLSLAARRYRRARFHGIDISSEMLATARHRIRRDEIEDVVRLAHGDAACFDASALFGIERFDRVYISYALSMIPAWERTVQAGLDVLAPGGSLHIVDFGRQERLPRAFKSGLRAWLKGFHVAPRDSLNALLDSECEKRALRLRFDSLFGGYSNHAIVGADGDARESE